MKVKGKKSLLPFQKGIIISMDSLEGLLKDQKQFGLQYVMTTRLTQDILERLFSQIRRAEHLCDHPTASEVISRLKKILLANKMPKPSTKTNIQTNADKPGVCLTAELVESAFSQTEVQNIIS